MSKFLDSDDLEGAINDHEERIKQNEGDIEWLKAHGGGGEGGGDFYADGTVPMTGDLDLSSNKIINVGVPTTNTDGVNKKYVDDVIAIEESLARQTCKDLASMEGIFCGTSSGMNVAGAIKLSKDLGPKSKVVAVACDTGLKYLSEGLFY